MMQRLQARIAKQLAEFRKSNTAPDYEEQARIILLLMIQDRLAEIREWREQHVGGRPNRRARSGRDGSGDRVERSRRLAGSIRRARARDQNCPKGYVALA
jgi:hypothetical protein